MEFYCINKGKVDGGMKRPMRLRTGNFTGAPTLTWGLLLLLALEGKMEGQEEFSFMTSWLLVRHISPVRYRAESLYPYRPLAGAPALCSREMQKPQVRCRITRMAA